MGTESVPEKRAAPVGSRFTIVSTWVLTSWSPAGVSVNLAADRIRGVVVDAGDLQCLSISPAGMAVDTPQVHRTVRNDRIDMGGGREFPDRPQYLVPATTLDPAGARVGFGVVCNALNCVFDARRPGEVELYSQESLTRDMSVRIDKPGQYELSAAVDLSGVCMFGGQVVIARGNDPSFVVKDQNTEVLDVAGCR